MDAEQTVHNRGNTSININEDGMSVFVYSKRCACTEEGLWNAVATDSSLRETKKENNFNIRISRGVTKQLLP